MIDRKKLDELTNNDYEELFERLDNIDNINKRIEDVNSKLGPLNKEIEAKESELEEAFNNLQSIDYKTNPLEYKDGIINYKNRQEEYKALCSEKEQLEKLEDLDNERNSIDIIIEKRDDEKEDLEPFTMNMKSDAIARTSTKNRDNMIEVLDNESSNEDEQIISIEETINRLKNDMQDTIKSIDNVKNGEEKQEEVSNDKFKDIEFGAFADSSPTGFRRTA